MGDEGFIAEKQAAYSAAERYSLITVECKKAKPTGFVIAKSQPPAGNVSRSKIESGFSRMIEAAFA